MIKAEKRIHVIEKRSNVQNNQLKALILTLWNFQSQNRVNDMAQTLFNSGILNLSSSKEGEIGKGGLDK
jgi:hypothetical protein